MAGEWLGNPYVMLGARMLQNNKQDLGAAFGGAASDVSNNLFQRKAQERRLGALEQDIKTRDRYLKLAEKRVKVEERLRKLQQAAAVAQASGDSQTARTIEMEILGVQSVLNSEAQRKSYEASAANAGASARNAREQMRMVQDMREKESAHRSEIAKAIQLGNMPLANRLSIEYFGQPLSPDAVAAKGRDVPRFRPYSGDVPVEEPGVLGALGENITGAVDWAKDQSINLFGNTTPPVDSPPVAPVDNPPLGAGPNRTAIIPPAGAPPTIPPLGGTHRSPIGLIAPEIPGIVDEIFPNTPPDPRIIEMRKAEVRNRYEAAKRTGNKAQIQIERDRYMQMFGETLD